MIVQTRSHGLQLIRQHDHAAVSGRLAHEWRGPARVDLRIPCRDLPPGPFATDDGLRAAWEAVPPATQRIRLQPQPPDPASGR